MEVKSGTLSGKTLGDIVDAESKSQYVSSLVDRGIQLERVIVVGDGANDLKMMNLAGVATGFRPKATLIDHIDGAIFDSMDQLASLLE